MWILTSSWLTHVQMIADSAFAQPSSESEGHHSVRPHSPSSHCPASPNGHPKPLGETLRPKEPPSPAVYPDKARGPSEGPVSKKSSSLLNSLRPPLPLQTKEGPHSVNGRTKPWDSFTPEEFAQQFHESVLQSTQKALQKHKGKSHGRPHFSNKAGLPGTLFFQNCFLGFYDSKLIIFWFWTGNLKSPWPLRNFDGHFSQLFFVIL